MSIVSQAVDSRAKRTGIPFLECEGLWLWYAFPTFIQVLCLCLFLANNPRSHHCQISSAFARISDVMCKMAHYAGRNGLGQKQLIMVADDPEHKRVVSSAKRENLFEVEPCLG